MAQKNIEVRLKIPHERKTETDIYITKDMEMSSTLSIISKRLKTNPKIKLHSTGAANYKALKLAAIIQEKNKDTVIAQVSTRTVQTASFIIPTKADAQREKKEKFINGVEIELIRK